MTLKHPFLFILPQLVVSTHELSVTPSETDTKFTSHGWEIGIFLTSVVRSEKAFLTTCIF